MSKKEIIITGLDKKTSGFLAYSLFWITGILFLIVDNDKEVRFHAWQSILFFGSSTVILWLIQVIFWGSIWSFVLGSAFELFVISIWIILMIKAYKGQRFTLPVFSKFAIQLSK